MIIMPISSAMVLGSIASSAWCWSRTPKAIIKPAPASATTARSSRSLMMTA